MSEFIVRASLTVSGDSVDRATVEQALDMGLRELPGVASRYGFTITDAKAEVEEAG